MGIAVWTTSSRNHLSPPIDFSKRARLLRLLGPDYCLWLVRDLRSNIHAMDVTPEPFTTFRRQTVSIISEVEGSGRLTRVQDATNFVEQ